MNKKNWVVKISLFISLVILNSVILTYAMNSSVASEFKVNQFTDFTPGEAAEDSAIVVDSNGRIIITWEDPRYNYDNIFARIFDNSGNPFTDDFRVDQDINTNVGSNPSIAIDSNDRFIITWEATMNVDQGSENDDVFARIFDSSGNPLTDEFRIDQDTGVSKAGEPVIATDGNNNFIIAWTDERNGNGDVFARIFDSNGNPLTDEFRIDQDTGVSEAGGPVIATDGNNNFIIAWADERNGNGDVFARIFDSNGNPLTDEFKVNQSEEPSEEDGPEDPAIAIDSNNHFIITWEESMVFARIFDNIGNALTDDFRVDQDPNSGSDPSISVDNNDQIIITWEETRSDQNPSNDDIFVRIFDSTGNPLTNEYRVDQDIGTNEAGEPVIATDSNNNFIIAWTDNRNGHTDIFATIVSNPAPDIKANNSDGPIDIQTGENLSVTVELDSGSKTGEDADWWVAESAPDGWYYYSLSTSWTSAGSSYDSLIPTYQGALFDLGSYSVLNTSGLSEGTHTYYFAIDTSMDGILDFDQLYYDSVVVTITGNADNFKLPDTGQTGSYTDTFGEDSDYTINPPSYTDNGNGTVTDINTGLMWQQEDDNNEYTWDDATRYCENLSLASHADWRLPDIKELEDIVSLGTYNPAIDETYFPNTNSQSYWSSTTAVSDTGLAWFVDFDNGDGGDGNKSNGNDVRCVRGGQGTADFSDNSNGTVTDNVTGLMWQQEDDDVQRNWEDAITYCEGLSLASHSDWRLPNIKELKSIVDIGVNNLAIDATYFPNTNSSYYWSSTTDVSDTGLAWSVGFSNGDIDNDYSKSDYGYVRCVRGPVQDEV